MEGKNRTILLNDLLETNTFAKIAQKPSSGPLLLPCLPPKVATIRTFMTNTCLIYFIVLPFRHASLNTVVLPGF